MVPTKPKRPCSYPGCPKLTDGRFCEEHAKAEAKRYEKYDRDPAVRRRYGRAWKRIRDRYIQEHPLCELCQQEGRLTPAEEVHHKKPLAEYKYLTRIKVQLIIITCLIFLFVPVAIMDG